MPGLMPILRQIAKIFAQCSVIAMIDVPIPEDAIASLDTPRKTLPRKSVFHLPQRYLRNVATRALPIVVFPRLIVGQFSPYVIMSLR